jgi:hypothetical protein
LLIILAYYIAFKYSFKITYMASLVVNLFSVLEQFVAVGRIVLSKQHRRSHKVKNYLHRYSILNSLPVYLRKQYSLSSTELAAIQATMSTEETASEAEEAYAYQDEYGNCFVRSSSTEFFHSYLFVPIHRYRSGKS